jgi:hypothetical protein
MARNSMGVKRAANDRLPGIFVVALPGCNIVPRMRGLAGPSSAPTRSSNDDD